MASVPNLGAMRATVQILRRDLLAPAPGTAEPRHGYTPILTTRADVKSHGGVNQFAQVEVDGKPVTHTFFIRYTTIPFDARDRLRDVRGKLYRILKVDNVDLDNVVIKISASDQGLEDVAAAR